MRRLGVALIAAAFSLLLVVVPISTTPAQAVQTVRTLACYSSLTCNPANLPILTAAGVGSSGAATVATGGTAAAVGTGALGTIGFNTVLGSVVAGIGLMTLKGVEEGLSIDTDPDYVPPVTGPAIAGVIQPRYHPSTVYDMSIAEVIVSGATATVNFSITAWGSGTANVGYRTMCIPTNATPTTVPALSGNLSKTRTSPTLWSATWTCGAGSEPYGLALGTVNSSGTVGPNVVLDRTRYITTGGAGTEFALWLGRLSEHYVPTLSPGYHGILRTTVQCRVSGNTTPVMTERRVDVEQGDPLEVPPASCAAGLAIGMKVEYQADGTTTWVELGKADAPGVGTYENDYPGCFASSQGSTCTLDLQRKDGTRWETCGPLANYCPGWVEEWVETPEVYRCKFGEHAVSIDLCSAFRKPGVLLPNVEETPGEDPQPVPPTAPAPNPLPNPVKNPDGTTPETPPWLDVEGDGSPSTRECWPTGWGVINPLAWVFMPVRCALEDAFVPRQSEIVKIQTRVKTALAGTSVEQVQQMAAGGLATIGEIPKTGCAGPHVVLNVPSINPFPGPHPPLIDYDGYPLSACEAPYDSAAFWARTIGGLVMLWFGGKLVLRNIAGIIDYSGRGPV